MKVFYSWQMDAPRKINKDFIYGALGDAIETLGKKLDLTAAERGGIELDQDTQGVLGSPEVARIIFEKIGAANVIVTDVSLVANGTGEKLHINSNVAIELGYAYGKIGDQSVIKIMNIHFGPAEKLPFDLRIRRHPIKYNLAPNADPAYIALERKKLSGQLARILKLYFKQAPSAPFSNAHIETPFLDLRGRYWNKNEPLVPRDENRKSQEPLSWFSKSILYFRCIPHNALPELTSRETHDNSANLRPLISENGYSYRRNKWGAISYDRDKNDNTLIGATQLFKNREIWGIDAIYSEVSIQYDEDENLMRIIPTGAINREYPRSINNIRNIALKLGYGDNYNIEMGLSGAEGFYLAISDKYFERFLGPIFESEVYIRKSISKNYQTGQIMNDFWERIFSEAGHSVPNELIWNVQD